MKFETEMIFVDFGKAIHNAILEIWTQDKIMSCTFNLGLGLELQQKEIIGNNKTLLL